MHGGAILSGSAPLFFVHFGAPEPEQDCSIQGKVFDYTNSNLD
jgi:hypothetical protein